MFGHEKRTREEQGAAPEAKPDFSRVYLGRHGGPTGPELFYGGDRHLLHVSPTGAGKGTRLLVGNALRLGDRSTIWFDFKHELTSITANLRAAVSQVAILNPYNLFGTGSVGFNPLVSLDSEAFSFVEDAAGVGEAIVPINPSLKEPHFDDKAREAITGLCMGEVMDARRTGRVPSLIHVHRMLTESDEVALVNGKKRLVKGFRRNVARMCAVGGAEVESLLAQFLTDSPEMASNLSTARRHTAWMLGRPMQADLAKRGFDLADLKRRPTSLFVVIPIEHLKAVSGWLRLLVVTAMRTLSSPGGYRTLMVLDEFKQLGYLSVIENALAIMRGMGVQLWPILQDVSQLREYGSWETFIANAGVVQGFAPNDLATAEWMSKRAGDTTAVAAGFNQGGSTGGRGPSNSDGMSYQQVRRPLILPHEFMGMKPGHGVMWSAGMAKTIPFYAPPYWEDPAVAVFAEPNPYYQPDPRAAWSAA